MFKSETQTEQAREITRLVRKLADVVPVALCSGNHDNVGRLVSHDRASVYEWFIALGAHPKIITDGSTRKLESLIVTTIPFHCSKEQKSIWLDRGLTIRRQAGKPWVVLHHVPPKHGLRVSGEELEASALLAAYQPDYFVSGHDHAFPYESSQGWNQKLGEVCVLVPGQLLGAVFPNYIELDTESGALSWRTISETWIPEDRLFDHLVLKLTKD